MPNRSRRATFSTTVAFPEDPNWRPLEALARHARESSDLPSFHEGEFMYMASARSQDGRTIHLYKHRDTRRYLNLDDQGDAYEYCGPSETGSGPMSAGCYRPHRSLTDAIDHVELWLFEQHPSFVRSFPPNLWPPGDDSKRRRSDPRTILEAHASEGLPAGTPSPSRQQEA